MITAVYLYGSWHDRWAFGPWWLAACVILDLTWIIEMAALAGVASSDPLIQIEMGEQGGSR